MVSLDGNVKWGIDRKALFNRMIQSTGPGTRWNIDGGGWSLHIYDDDGDLWAVEAPSYAYALTEIAETATRVWELTDERMVVPVHREDERWRWRRSRGAPSCRCACPPPRWTASARGSSTSLRGSG